MLTHLTKGAAAALRRGSINITQSLRAARPAIALGVALAVTAVSHAAVDTEITDMTTNASTVFTTVKAIVISVVGFLILLGFVKLVKKR